jgi:hypothetical protein
MMNDDCQTLSPQRVSVGTKANHSHFVKRGTFFRHSGYLFLASTIPLTATIKLEETTFLHTLGSWKLWSKVETAIAATSARCVHQES